MPINTPAGYYDIRKETLVPVPGIGGTGTIVKEASKAGGKLLQRGISGLTGKALQTRSGAAGYGTGAGIGIAGLLQESDETGTTPTSGSLSQAGRRFNPPRRFRRYKQYRRSCNCCR